MDTKTLARMARKSRAGLSITAFAAAIAPSFVPTLALACPGYASNASSCGSSAGSYLSALGLGLAIGIGSSALEGIFQKKS
jgi:hypothetical protein